MSSNNRKDTHACMYQNVNKLQTEIDNKTDNSYFFSKNTEKMELWMRELRRDREEMRTTIEGVMTVIQQQQQMMDESNRVVQQRERENAARIQEILLQQVELIKSLTADLQRAKQTQADEFKRKERFKTELLYDREELSRREGELKLREEACKQIEGKILKE